MEVAFMLWCASVVLLLRRGSLKVGAVASCTEVQSLEVTVGTVWRPTLAAPWPRLHGRGTEATGVFESR